MIKTAVAELVGKKIVGVIVKQNSQQSSPRMQLFLLFSDDTYYFKSLLPANRDMADLLSARGYPVTYREYPGGHNYPAWRDEVWRGLEKLFPA